MVIKADSRKQATSSSVPLSVGVFFFSLSFLETFNYADGKLYYLTKFFFLIVFCNIGSSGNENWFSVVLTVAFL